MLPIQTIDLDKDVPRVNHTVEGNTKGRLFNANDGANLRSMGTADCVRSRED